METGLEGKTVLVTGASGGIGRAIVKGFANEGARIALHANKNLETVETLREELAIPTLVVQGDLTKEAHVQRVFHCLL